MWNARRLRLLCDIGNLSTCAEKVEVFVCGRVFDQPMSDEQVEKLYRQLNNKSELLVQKLSIPKLHTVTILKGNPEVSGTLCGS